MAEWINPIFDRTQADVDFALSKIAEWRNSKADGEDELRGCLNVSDINRIENNIRYLSDNLSDLCYFPHADTRVWDSKGLPDTDDISRIIGHIRKIISAFCQHDTAPALPETMLTYEQINDIEGNLYLLKGLLGDMIVRFKECGTFECGEE